VRLIPLDDPDVGGRTHRDDEYANADRSEEIELPPLDRLMMARDELDDATHACGSLLLNALAGDRFKTAATISETQRDILQRLTFASALFLCARAEL
jgi:hypothetical protein